MRAAVRLRNAGGTSPPVPSDVSLTLRGSMGSAAAPRVASLTASDPDNSGPGYSNGDLLTLRFDVSVFVRYRSWTQVFADDPNAAAALAAEAAAAAAAATAAAAVAGRPDADSSDALFAADAAADSELAADAAAAGPATLVSG